jgi:hypothetical protein
MDEEITTLDKNGDWDLVEFPTGINPIGNKWVFKNKLNVEGKVETYKAQLVAKGYLTEVTLYSHVDVLWLKQ